MGSMTAVYRNAMYKPVLTEVAFHRRKHEVILVYQNRNRIICC